MNPEKFTTRPLAYNNIDGVGELSCGFMCLAWGVLGWMQCHAAKGSAWHSMFLFGPWVGVMLAVIHYGSRAIKERITYPRTGFVEYRKQGRWWPALLAGVVAALVPVALVLAHRAHWELKRPAALYGLILAAGYAYNLARTARWKWAVVGGMAMGTVAIASLRADAIEMFWLTFLLYGPLLMISGAITFWLYVRGTHALHGEEAL